MKQVYAHLKPRKGERADQGPDETKDPLMHFDDRLPITRGLSKILAERDGIAPVPILGRHRLPILSTSRIEITRQMDVNSPQVPYLAGR